MSKKQESEPARCRLGCRCQCRADNCKYCDAPKKHYAHHDQRCNCDCYNKDCECEKGYYYDRNKRKSRPCVSRCKNESCICCDMREGIRFSGPLNYCVYRHSLCSCCTGADVVKGKKRFKSAKEVKVE